MINILITLVAIALLWSIWGYFGSRVEQADYSVVKRTKGYEIREYPAHIVAQTKAQGPYGKSMSSGFRIIAGYIFGGNTKKESIAMTAPVVATAEGDSQWISFSMPRSYKLETLPTPNDSRVKIVMVPAKKYGVMRFSWYRSDIRIKRRQEKLILALARDGFTSVGSSAYAGYNAPWTPPWMTRNEVLVELK
jgi:effector-binding domain-containing protein